MSFTISSQTNEFSALSLPSATHQPVVFSRIEVLLRAMFRCFIRFMAFGIRYATSFRQTGRYFLRTQDSSP